ncbi:hypothetical protein DBB42_27625 [Pseudomonas plecoglossicida]|uniref:Uncharacterized protein n=1 Tax=Pseudomonas plecoglossicida TaxID=70775 RepID=A0A2R7U9Y9_PSEDL|nr:hypothetical protein DBB42_27625 [Pseudomonas plecoglossicida]
MSRFDTCTPSVGAGSPAKNATRYMAPASPVFAGEPAPTVIVQVFGIRAKQLLRYYRADFRCKLRSATISGRSRRRR